MDFRRSNKKKYNISQNRYNELLAFCKQYPEWQEKLNELEPTAKSQVLDGMPHSNTNVTSDPTASTGIKRADIESKIKLIDDTLRETDPLLAEWLRQNICEGKTMDYLITFCQAPVNKATFTDRRRKFFYLLHLKKNKCEFLKL